MTNLSKNIRYLRRQREMSQNQLADMLGKKSFTTIQKWESGSSEPSVADATKIADIFNITLNELVGEDLEIGIDSASEPADGSCPSSTCHVPEVIAAHFEGDRYSEDEVCEIDQFIEFVKSKRGK